jgi:hypothetical protein
LPASAGCTLCVLLLLLISVHDGACAALFGLYHGKVAGGQGVVLCVGQEFALLPYSS